MLSALHIRNDYSVPAVYWHLVEAVDGLGIQQKVLTAVRKPGRVGGDRPTFLTPGGEEEYSTKWSRLYRVFFMCKLHAAYDELLRLVSLDGVTLVHAHTLYSDGALAYRLYRERSLPYVVTVRSTDVNLYAHKALHLRALGRDIPLHAVALLVTSPPCSEPFLKSCPLLATGFAA